MHTPRTTAQLAQDIQIRNCFYNCTIPKMLDCKYAAVKNFMLKTINSLMKNVSVDLFIIVLFQINALYVSNACTNAEFQV